MKNKKLIDAIGKIDDKYIEEAKEVKKKKFVFNWAFIGKTLSAALCVVIVISFISNTFGMGAAPKYEQATTETYSMDNGSFAVSGARGDYVYQEAVPAEAEETKKTAANPMLSDATVNKKLIVNGGMNIETTEFDAVMDYFDKAIKEVGGYIQNSSINQRGNECRYFNATIRIPSDKYANFVSKAKESSNVTYYNEYVEDITDTYTDLEARLNSLKAEEEKVLEFYSKAVNLEELMSVESRLTDIRYEIDSIQTRLKNYDLLVSYSTLNVSIEETKVYSKVDDSFFSRIGNAFINGFNNFLNAIEDFVVNIVYNIWQILLIIVVIIVAIVVIKKIRRKEKE